MALTTVALMVYWPVGRGMSVLSSVQLSPSTVAKPVATTVEPSADRISTRTFSPAARVAGNLPE